MQRLGQSLDQSLIGRLVALFFLGFSSGFPFLLTLSTLSFWLMEEGFDKTTIGWLMLTNLPYGLKFLWAPLMDRYQLPVLSKRLGQRRSWGIASQVGLVLSLWVMSASHPSDAFLLMLASAFLVSFFGASQDIVIEAYRIEIIPEELRGYGSAMETLGFRVGMIYSGAVALYLAANWGWACAYQVMAVSVAIGMVTFALMREPKTGVKHLPLTAFQWRSYNDFWTHFAYKEHIYWIVCFVFFFKFTDIVVQSMSAPFFFELGYSKIEYADYTKVLGTFIMAIGAVLGGVLCGVMGMKKTLMIALILQAMAAWLLMFQSLVPEKSIFIVIVIGFESFASGISATALLAYLPRFCRPPYIAAQFSMLLTIASLSRVVTSMLSGIIADKCGWTVLFALAGLTVIPGLYALHRLEQE